MFQNANFFIALAIFFGTASKLLHKKVMRGADTYAFALLTNALCAVIFFTLSYPTMSFPREPAAWGVLLLASVLWTTISVTVLISYKKADVSIRDPLSQSKTIIALILGLLILGEIPSIMKIFGTILIFLGITLLVYHPEKRFGHLTDAGVRWTFFTALLSGVEAIVDKAALTWFRFETYAFLVYVLPTIILCLFLRGRTRSVRKFIKDYWFSGILAIVFSSAAYYFTLNAFSLIEVTVAYPLLQLTTLLTVLGGIFILGERQHIRQKLFAAIIIIIASMMVK
ncbi:MAG: EamA family transporter [Parcubacteria group bacterium]|nr:EamA family transporter [Parcubacteria group bacterium]